MKLSKRTEPNEEGAEPAEEKITIDRTTRARRFSSRVLERGTPAKQSKERKALMKRFKKAKSIPSETEVERFTPELDKGLSQEQVGTRLNQFLFNDVNKKYSKSYKSIFFGNICTVFNLLCLLAAVALVFARAPVSQFLFVGIFGLNLIIGIVQEILAKKQIDKLAVLVSSTAKVMRDGVKTEIPLRDIVLDDVILLETGMQVPADCVLADGVAEVNESLLTGESVPVKKNRGDLLYAGSFISSGACRVRAERWERRPTSTPSLPRRKNTKNPVRRSSTLSVCLSA